MDPQQAWKQALHNLQTEIPKAQFDTWVRDAQLIRFEEDVAFIGAQNAYARDWLAERLGDKITSTLTNLFGHKVDVRFVLAGGNPAIAPREQAEQEKNKAKPDIAICAKEYDTVYEQVVLPHQQVVLPGYFRRHLREIGPKMAWMYVAFRQAAYKQGARRGVQAGTFSGKQIAALCGVSDRTFWRRIKKEDTWNALTGLVSRIDEAEPQWQDGSELRRLPLQYEVAMTLPLTGPDAQSLSLWLKRHIEECGGPEGVLQAACQAPLDELIPLEADREALTWQPMTVRQVVLDLFAAMLPSNQLETLASTLQNHIMPPKSDTLHITLFFLEHVLPYLSAGEAWLLTLLRDQCYVNKKTGEVRNNVTVSGGYQEIASWLGLSRPQTIGEWLSDPTSVLAMYLYHQKGEIRGEHEFEILLEEIPPVLLEIALDDEQWETFKQAMQAIIKGEEPSQEERCQRVLQYLPARFSGSNQRECQYRTSAIVSIYQRDCQY